MFSQSRTRGQRVLYELAPALFYLGRHIVELDNHQIAIVGNHLADTKHLNPVRIVGVELLRVIEVVVGIGPVGDEVQNLQALGAKLGVSAGLDGLLEQLQLPDDEDEACNRNRHGRDGTYGLDNVGPLYRVCQKHNQTLYTNSGRVRTGRALLAGYTDSRRLGSSPRLRPYVRTNRTENALSSEHRQDRFPCECRLGLFQLDDPLANLAFSHQRRPRELALRLL